MSLASFLLYYLTHFGVLFCISTCSLHLCCLIAKTYRLNLRSLYRGIDWDKMITQFLEHWIPVTFDNVYFSWLLEFLSVDMTISVTLTMAIISKSYCLFSFPENQLQKIEKNTEFIYESNNKIIHIIKYFSLPFSFVITSSRRPAPAPQHCLFQVLVTV